MTTDVTALTTAVPQQPTLPGSGLAETPVRQPSRTAKWLADVVEKVRTFSVAGLMMPHPDHG
jgi:hypothetical protein